MNFNLISLPRSTLYCIEPLFINQICINDEIFDYYRILQFIDVLWIFGCKGGGSLIISGW